MDGHVLASLRCELLERHRGHPRRNGPSDIPLHRGALNPDPPLHVALPLTRGPRDRRRGMIRHTNPVRDPGRTPAGVLTASLNLLDQCWIGHTTVRESGLQRLVEFSDQLEDAVVELWP